MNIGYFVTLSPIGQERPWLTTRPSSNSFARQKQKLDYDVEPIWIEKTMKLANVFQMSKRHSLISNRIVFYHAGITPSFRTSVSPKRKSNFSVMAKCRHVLESLESAMTRNKEPVDLANVQISIEHIMPQTLNEEWEQLLGEKAAAIYDTYLHTIGNLTLTGSNSDLGNETLLAKRKIYSESNFALNKELADAIVWSEYTIKQRAQKLGKIAVDIWKHPGETAKATANGLGNNQDPTGKKPTGFSLFGTEYQVDSWRDLLLTVLGELVARHGSEFEDKAIQVKTSRRAHIARQPDNMFVPVRIPGSELWVEANQSSRSVLWVIDQTLTTLGDREEDFEAYW